MRFVSVEFLFLAVLAAASVTGALVAPAFFDGGLGRVLGALLGPLLTIAIVVALSLLARWAEDGRAAHSQP